ncbi:MAG: hypothetical protein IPL94_13800 [Tetrasphaera sp.]|nr:hypothetical protein [Tetrasphaera sp.]
MSTEPLIHGESRPLDPLGDADRLTEAGVKKNFAKVGSGRPSSLLYTYGPGAIMDLPHFTVMPSGLDDWERIWARRDGVPSIHAPALLEVVRMLLGHQVREIRPFPRQPSTTAYSRDGADLGIPARVFPQWMRCTGCDRLAPISSFEYKNTHPFRPDEAIFEHVPCHGRRGTRGKERGKGKGRRQPVVTARYLLACADGHLDEFPYEWWVHDGGRCPAADAPVLKMIDHAGGRGASATIVCESCSAKRPMNQAQGEVGRANLPRCRGRMPHLDGFVPDGCRNEARLMLVGASNLWFPALASAIVMPRLDPAQRRRDLADQIAVALGTEKLAKYAANGEMLRDLLDARMDVSELADAELEELARLALEPPETEDERHARREGWDPVDLLVPEWRYLQREPASQFHEDAASGLTLSPRVVSARMPGGVSRVLAVDRLRKVNALVGFTRIDEMDRVNDLTSRLVPITRAGRPEWVVGTEDRGEGIFLQLEEVRLAAWEARVVASDLWAAHQAAHRRNFERRFSETATQVDPESRFKPPRYWLLHTLAHVMLRQLAMSSGYGAASLTERVYAWGAGGPERPPAAGVLIATTSSDSDGTLGGLVRLSDPDLLSGVVRSALLQSSRCSSDPLCAQRSPKDPEDFLHGAACHCCVMASETSCERANRFLDRRLLIDLPGSDLGFFGDPRRW